MLNPRIWSKTRRVMPFWLAWVCVYCGLITGRWLLETEAVLSVIDEMVRARRET